MKDRKKQFSFYGWLILLIAVLGCVAAWMVVPEFRSFWGLGIDKKEEIPTAEVPAQELLRLSDPVRLEPEIPVSLFQKQLSITYLPREQRSLLDHPPIWSDGMWKIQVKIVSKDPLSDEVEWYKVGDMIRYEDEAFIFTALIKEIDPEYLIIE